MKTILQNHNEEMEKETSEKYEKKLLTLIRERRKYEYKTLDGYKPSNPHIHHLLSEEIEVLQKTIGGQNKTRLRKEAKGNLYLTKLLNRGETII